MGSDVVLFILLLLLLVAFYMVRNRLAPQLQTLHTTFTYFQRLRIIGVHICIDCMCQSLVIQINISIHVLFYVCIVAIYDIVE